MQFKYNDGGRAAAGYKGNAGDCVTRALAIAMQLPYQDVYDAMAAGNAGERITKRTKVSAGRRSARNGIYAQRKWFKDWMTARGWKWVPTMTIGSGCKVHLRADELPMGRIIARVSRHMCAVIDGVIHDTYDPSERGATIYPSNYQGAIPAGARQLDTGNWAYEPDRCVYGYWVKA